MAAERIRASRARADLQAGKALLVCAYDSNAKFEQNRLEGALSLAQFRAIEDTVPKDREIVFY